MNIVLVVCMGKGLGFEQICKVVFDRYTINIEGSRRISVMWKYLLNVLESKYQWYCRVNIGFVNSAIDKFEFYCMEE